MWLRTVFGLMPSESALRAEDISLLLDRFLTEFSAQYHHLPEDIRASKDNARTMMITLGTFLEQIQRDIIRRTLAEAANHQRENAATVPAPASARSCSNNEYGIREYPRTRTLFFLLRPHLLLFSFEISHLALAGHVSGRALDSIPWYRV